MTLIRLNQKAADRSFNNLIDHFFSATPSFIQEGNSRFVQNQVPVNITETEEGYQLDLIAPGLEKENFRISLEKNLLTIAGENSKQEENKTGKQIRREYRFNSFTRSFTVDANIDAENISAKYVNGILTLNLPRKAAVKEETKKINIQ